MVEDFTLIFSLLALFQVKHFLADFPFQRGFMLQKKAPGWSFVLPLALHCGVHALGSLIILLIFSTQLWWLCIFDFVIHFVMDRIKSGPRYLGRFNDSSRSSYWNVFGLDQMIHHFTHYFIIWAIVSH